MNSIHDGNRKLIAISGKQLSGKDYLAKLLLQKLPVFKRVGLGDAIKMELAGRKSLSVQEIEANKHLYRPELIELGNEGRNLEEGLYWVRKVLSVPGNLIIPDMRMPREFEAFKSAGAVMVRVEADYNTRAARGTLVKEDDPTEKALDNMSGWDFVIDNNNGVHNLEKQIEHIIKYVNNAVKAGNI
jgi:phosphomevalonate kinase